jgi:hypothetical protein
MIIELGRKIGEQRIPILDIPVAKQLTRATDLNVAVPRAVWGLTGGKLIGSCFK